MKRHGSPVDWTDPKWSNPLVHVAANGSWDSQLEESEGVSDQ